MSGEIIKKDLIMYSLDVQMVAMWVGLDSTLSQTRPRKAFVLQIQNISRLKMLKIVIKIG